MVADDVVPDIVQFLSATVQVTTRMIPSKVWCVKHAMEQRDWSKFLRAMRTTWAKATAQCARCYRGTVETEARLW